MLFSNVRWLQMQRSHVFSQSCRVFLDGATYCMIAPLKVYGQTSFFKLLSKDYHGEIQKNSRKGLLSYSCQAVKAYGKVEKSSLELKVGTIWWTFAHDERWEVWLIQSERFGENHVMNSAILKMSKLCWWVRGSWECVQSPMLGRQDRTTSRIKCWTDTVQHLFAQDARWVQDRFRPIVEQKFRSVLKRKLQIALLTIDRKLRSRQYDYCTGQLLERDKNIAGRKKKLHQLESFGVIRRVKKSEATDGTHLRVKITVHNKGDLVRWRLVSLEVNQYKRHDVFVDTSTSVYLLQKQQVTDNANHEIIAILDVVAVFLHTDLQEVNSVVVDQGSLRHAERRSFLTGVVSQWCFHESWLGRSGGGGTCVSHHMEFGWWRWCKCLRARRRLHDGVEYRCGSRSDHDVGIESWHQCDLNHWTRSGNWCQDRQTSLVLESCWILMESISKGCAWFFAWTEVTQSRVSATSSGTVATTNAMRNALDVLSWEQVKAVSSAWGTATHLAMDRSDVVWSIRRANQDIAKPKVQTEVRLTRVAGYSQSPSFTQWLLVEHTVNTSRTSSASCKWMWLCDGKLIQQEYATFVDS